MRVKSVHVSRASSHSAELLATDCTYINRIAHGIGSQKIGLQSSITCALKHPNLASANLHYFERRKLISPFAQSTSSYMTARLSTDYPSIVERRERRKASGKSMRTANATI